MVDLFKDLPEAIENTINISKMCLVKSVKRDPILPSFSDGSLSEGDILDQQAHEGFKRDVYLRLNYQPLKGITLKD